MIDKEKYDNERAQLIEETLIQGHMPGDGSELEEAVGAPGLGETLQGIIKDDPQFEDKMVDAATDGVIRAMTAAGKRFKGLATGWRLKLRTGLTNKKNKEELKRMVRPQIQKVISDAIRSVGGK